MSRPYDIITFYCYGTLIDWESGISEACMTAAFHDGVGLSRQTVLEAHAEIEPVVQAERFRSYRDVLAETARRMADRFGWALDPTHATFLPQSLPGWRAFPDTNPALERLAAAGYRLGILSNVDDDLLTGTLYKMFVKFDPIVTAEQVGAYKPNHAHFLTARERIGDARWLHAAQSYFHDVVPARELGIPVAWINRKAETPSGAARPDRELSTLTDLTDWLA